MPYDTLKPAAEHTIAGKPNTFPSTGLEMLADIVSFVGMTSLLPLPDRSGLHLTFSVCFHCVGDLKRVSEGFIFCSLSGFLLFLEKFDFKKNLFMNLFDGPMPRRR